MNFFFKSFIRAIAFLGLLQVSVVAQASNFIGNVCFQLQLLSEEESSFLTLGISEVGAGHFMAHGYSYNSLDDTAEERTLLHGNVELFGETISLSLTGSYSRNEEMLSFTAHANLSASTLSGPVSVIATFHDFDGEESGIEAEAGTMSPIACAEA